MNSLSWAARPNILFAVADDLSYTSTYGYGFIQTPCFDSLAVQGLHFDRVFTPSSNCSPSRADIRKLKQP